MRSELTGAAAEPAGLGARRLQQDPQRRRVRLELRALQQAGALRPVLPIAMFELGNMATAVLILRATTLLHHGHRTLAPAITVAVLIYAAHNFFGSLVAYAGGHWLDRAGARIVATVGLLRAAASPTPAFLYAAGWMVLSLASTLMLGWMR